MADHPAKKRVCVITSGNVRVIDPCTGILLKQLRAAGHPIDFHAVFWDDSDLDAARAALSGLDSLTFWTVPRVNFVEDLSAYPKSPEVVVHNFLSMTWSRIQLRRKLEEHGVFDRYDVFVFVRLDNCFGPVDFNNPGPVLDYEGFDQLLTEYDALLPANGHWNNGWNDQFVAARASGMRKWLSLFDHVRAYLEEGVLLHPETMLRHHMERLDQRRGLVNLVNFLWRSETVFRVG